MKKSTKLGQKNSKKGIKVQGRRLRKKLRFLEVKHKNIFPILEDIFAMSRASKVGKMISKQSNMRCLCLVSQNPFLVTRSYLMCLLQLLISR